MNLADIVVIILLLALLYVCFRSVFIKKSSGCGCSGNCANCALACMHHRKTTRFQ
ncbi:MAG: FeoB-associated Cys-rich membrane protein [Erysipelotrichaceae bacterium]|nr:FeoB-associated Cys-rich membrane protein [Erysipelotrichaceae bacterium]